MNNSQPQLSVACTTEMSSGGYVIVAGPLVTGRQIGSVFWDATGLDAGLVLKVEGETYTPDTVDEVATILANHGWWLAEESMTDVRRLCQ